MKPPRPVPNPAAHEKRRRDQGVLKAWEFIKRFEAADTQPLEDEDERRAQVVAMTRRILPKPMLDHATDEQVHRLWADYMAGRQ